jgi:hypothetical protein
MACVLICGKAPEQYCTTDWGKWRRLENSARALRVLRGRAPRSTELGGHSSSSIAALFSHLSWTALSFHVHRNKFRFSVLVWAIIRWIHRRDKPTPEVLRSRSDLLLGSDPKIIPTTWSRILRTRRKRETSHKKAHDVTSCRNELLNDGRILFPLKDAAKRGVNPSPIYDFLNPGLDCSWKKLLQTSLPAAGISFFTKSFHCVNLVTVRFAVF